MNGRVIELKKEIAQTSEGIQQKVRQVEESVGQVMGSVQHRVKNLSIKNQMDKNPLACLGVSVLSGLFLGYRFTRRSGYPSGHRAPMLQSAVLGELRSFKRTLLLTIATEAIRVFRQKHQEKAQREIRPLQQYPERPPATPPVL